MLACYAFSTAVLISHVHDPSTYTRPPNLKEYPSPQTALRSSSMLAQQHAAVLCTRVFKSGAKKHGCAVVKHGTSRRSATPQGQHGVVLPPDVLLSKPELCQLELMLNMLCHRLLMPRYGWQGAPHGLQAHPHQAGQKHAAEYFLGGPAAVPTTCANKQCMFFRFLPPTDALAAAKEQAAALVRKRLS